MQPEERGEGELTDMSGCTEKDEVIPEEVTLEKTSHCGRSWRLFCNIESAKDEMLETGPDLERSRTVCRSAEKVPDPCPV